MIDAAAQELGGTGRFDVGDRYCVTFAEAHSIAAAERMIRSWNAIRHPEQFGCTISIALHRAHFAYSGPCLRPGRLDRFTIAKCIGQAARERAERDLRH